MTVEFKDSTSRNHYGAVSGICFWWLLIGIILGAAGGEVAMKPIRDWMASPSQAPPLGNQAPPLGKPFDRQGSSSELPPQGPGTGPPAGLPPAPPPSIPGDEQGKIQSGDVPLTPGPARPK